MFDKWKRRLIGRKIWISKPEIKYSNNIIVINLYIYNRQYSFFLKKLNKLRFSWGRRFKIKLIRKWKRKKISFTKKRILFTKKSISLKKYLFRKIIHTFKNKPFRNKNYFLKNKPFRIFFKDKYPRILKKSLNKRYKFIKNLILFRNILLGYLEKLNKEKIFFFSKIKLPWGRKQYFEIFPFELKEMESFLKSDSIWEYLLYISDLSIINKIFKYQMLCIKYRQAIIFNKLKFKDAYLVPIKNFFKKIYKKKIEFNLISLKRFNHDSSILAQILTTKIRNRRNKPLKMLKTSIRKSKVYKFNKGVFKKQDEKLIEKQNYILDNFFENVKDMDYLNNILNNELSTSNNLQKIVLSSIKNKIIAGIKVQASGRITRRLIAQRATCKIRYKGTLKNIDSAYKGLSTPILKGYEKSTVQYTYLTAKRRIGAFGLKGWINTY